MDQFSAAMDCFMISADNLWTKLYVFINPSTLFFCICFTDVKQLPEDD